MLLPPRLVLLRPSIKNATTGRLRFPISLAFEDGDVPPPTFFPLLYLLHLPALTPPPPPPPLRTIRFVNQKNDKKISLPLNLLNKINEIMKEAGARIEFDQIAGSSDAHSSEKIVNSILRAVCMLNFFNTENISRA